MHIVLGGYTEFDPVNPAFMCSSAGTVYIHSYLYVTFMRVTPEMSRESVYVSVVYI